MKPFIERITSEGLISRLNEVCEQRSDMRVLRNLLGEQKMLQWVHSVGVYQDEGFRALVPPTPPVELRRITNAPDLPEFLWRGLIDIEKIMTLYENVIGPTQLERPRILDFGCGCGRMVRFLSAYSAERSIHACDVNLDHVRWCQENLTDIQTTQCDVLPPLPYQDQTFDLVYSLSVFTHLSESNAGKWLSEMHRVLAPQGILIATTSGISTLEIIRDSVAQQQMFNLELPVVVDTLRRLKEERFIFCQYDQNTLDIAKAGEEYGTAFIHRDCLYEECGSADFEVVEFLPGGLHGYQDIIILRRSF